MTLTRPYRKLVEHHVRRQTEAQIMLALQGELELLPDRLSEHVEEFLDVTNEKVGCDKEFWSKATCGDAAKSISESVAQVIPKSLRRKHIDMDSNPVSSKALFGFFQIATLNFAYSASSQAGQRKFMGIRKGLFR